MFFSVTKRKIISLIVLVGVIAALIIVSFSLDSRFKIGDATGLHLRSLKEDVDYWWATGVLGKGWAKEVIYEGAGGTARSIPVLVYHGLPDEGGGENPFNISRFMDQMNALHSAGWKTITLDEFERFIRGDIKLPEKSFLLTFDDGRKDTFYPSNPVLQDLGMSAVMFAITKKSTSPTGEQSTYYLSTYELGAMERGDNWEVESHGRDSRDWYYIDDNENIGHFFSNRLWLPEQNRIESVSEFKERIAYDLSRSRSDLEEVLDKDVRSIAFPFSGYGQDGTNYPGAVDAVLDEVPKHYRLAFYQVWDNAGETFNYPSEDEFMMRRIEPLGDWSGAYLASIMESGISKDLPYDSTTFGEEWRRDWGEVKGGETLSLKAVNNSTGASVALNGTWWWEDYMFSADTKWNGGSNVVLVARRGDDDDYLGCNFEADRIYIKTVIGGASHNLLSANYPLNPEGKTINIGMSVKDNSIACLVNGQVVLENQTINRRIANGGIGFEVWDQRNGVANVEFDNIKVSGL